ncbi:MAG: class I SAM-dependent methyltransferase [Chloroflexota bacterium]
MTDQENGLKRGARTVQALEKSMMVSSTDVQMLSAAFKKQDRATAATADNTPATQPDQKIVREGTDYFVVDAAGNKSPLTGIENPYALDAAIDAPRLYAQGKLFFEYMRRHWTGLIGRPKTILDAGCGSGYLTNAMSTLFPEAVIVGVDRSEKNLNEAKSSYEKNAKITFVQGDIQEDLHVPDDSQEMIHLSLVTLHLQHPEKFFALAYKALKPGGMLYLKDPYAGFPNLVPQGTASAELMKNLFDTAEKLGSHPYITDEIPELALAAGFLAKNIKVHLERYFIGSHDAQSRIAMSTAYASAINAAPYTEKLGVAPAAHTQELFMNASEEVMGTNLGGHTIRFPYPYIIYIIKKPLS